MSIIITHSDIAAFLKCRRQWRWSWLEDRNPPEPVTGYFAVGHRVHKVLDGFYSGGGDPFEIHEKLAAEAIELVESGNSPNRWDSQHIYDDVVVSRNCVLVYFDWMERTGADHGMLTAGVEETIEVPILGGDVILRGKTDLRQQWEDTGYQTITDYKTTGRPVSQLEVELEKSYQGYVYRCILAILHPELHITATRYRIIEKPKKIKPGREYVHQFDVPGMLRATPNVFRQIEGICVEILSVIDRLGSMHPDALMYPTPGEHCTWCAFRNPCLITNQDPAAGEEMLDDLFAPGRHRRYETLASLPHPVPDHS